MANLRYAPDFRIEINGMPVPAALRASISSVSFQTGLEGSDRVELALVNEGLRWLDHDLLKLDNTLTLHIGYAPDPLEQVFVGEIVGQAPTFPSGGSPMLTVTAQDRREHMQNSKPVRWFAVSIPSKGNYPIPDVVIAHRVAKEHGLIPIFDPVGAALSVLIGGAEVAVATVLGNPTLMQALIRKQSGESSFSFLQRIARENGWEVLMDHSGAQGGWQLHFLSLAEHLSPEVTLKYGQSLVDFTPRITKVGQIAGMQVKIWEPDSKLEFIISASWDWDRNSLNVNVSAGFGLPGTVEGTPEALKQEARQAKTKAGEDFLMAASKTLQKEIDKPYQQASVLLLEEPVNHLSAPRFLLSKLLSRLNQRLTGSGSTIGDPRIRAGTVLRLEGLGQQFGGLYRVTSATHTIDSGGYRTSFDVRKEIWFGSVPLFEQGAVKLNLPSPQVF